VSLATLVIYKVHLHSLYYSTTLYSILGEGTVHPELAPCRDSLLLKCAELIEEDDNALNLGMSCFSSSQQRHWR
jgi:hypothetical protein